MPVVFTGKLCESLFPEELTGNLHFPEKPTGKGFATEFPEKLTGKGFAIEFPVDSFGKCGKCTVPRDKHWEQGKNEIPSGSHWDGYASPLGKALTPPMSQ